MIQDGLSSEIKINKVDENQRCSALDANVKTLGWTGSEYPGLKSHP